jgi:hypothetical protein
MKKTKNMKKKESESNLLALSIFLFGCVGVFFSLCLGYEIDIKVVKKKINTTSE